MVNTITKPNNMVFGQLMLFNPTRSGGGGHKVPGSIFGPLMSMFMVQVPTQQHESMNLCISSHMKGKIAFIGNFSALANDSSKTSTIQILTNFEIFGIFQKMRFLAVAFQALV